MVTVRVRVSVRAVTIPAPCTRTRTCTPNASPTLATPASAPISFPIPTCSCTHTHIRICISTRNLTCSYTCSRPCSHTCTHTSVSYPYPQCQESTDSSNERNEKDKFTEGKQPNVACNRLLTAMPTSIDPNPNTGPNCNRPSLNPMNYSWLQHPITRLSHHPVPSHTHAHTPTHTLLWLHTSSS